MLFDFLIDEDNLGEFSLSLLVSFIRRFPAFRTGLVEFVVDRLVMEGEPWDEDYERETDHEKWLNARIDAKLAELDGA